MLFGPDGRVVAHNERAAELLGGDEERLRLHAPASTEGWRDTHDRPLHPEAHPAVLARAATGVVTQLLCIPGRDAERRWVQARACAVDDPQSHAEIVMTLSDVTELRAAQADLARCSEEALRVAVATSHDLGVPLAVLRRELAEIASDDLAPAAAAGLADARAAADAMSGIVGAVLSYVQVEREVVEDETVDLDAIAHEVVTLLRSHLQQVGATVCLDLEELPVITGCPILIRQLLQNLVANAIVHHPGPSPVIVIRATQRGGTPLLIVEDDGDGIPEDAREAVFGLFARGRASGEGHGIGLSAARRIAERHGGRIWIEDAVPRGARFCVALPGA